MSIYGKPLSELTTADLQELLDNRSIENVRLEFKAEVPGKDETLKKLSSFANTFGGYMVIGVKESNTDRRIEGLPGVEVQDGYKQKIVDWCFSAASPPLTAEVSDAIPVPAGNGKVCYVIYVAESEVAPHFLNDRKGIFVRTDEFSARFEERLADENELRHLFDRRKLIVERRECLLARARVRFKVFSAAALAESSEETKQTPILELRVVPRFPARQLCEQHKLRSLVAGSSLEWRGVGFPISGSEPVSQHESAIVLKPVGGVSMLEANVWGMLFYCAEIAEAHGRAETWGIHLYSFVGHILAFLKHADNMLRGMGYSGPICVDAAIKSMFGSKWLVPRYGVLVPRPGSVLDDDLSFSITTTTEALHQKQHRVAIDIFRIVFNSVNFPDLDSEQRCEDLILKGFTYNSWQPPVHLEI